MLSKNTKLFGASTVLWFSLLFGSASAMQQENNPSAVLQSLLKINDLTREIYRSLVNIQIQMEWLKGNTDNKDLIAAMIQFENAQAAINSNLTNALENLKEKMESVPEINSANKEELNNSYEQTKTALEALKLKFSQTKQE
jgi:hypothetical protein